MYATVDWAKPIGWSILVDNSVPTEQQNSHMVIPVQEWHFSCWILNNQKQGVKQLKKLAVDNNVPPEQVRSESIWFMMDVAQGLENASLFDNIVVGSGYTKKHHQAEHWQE
jgi:hypothetical protein